MSQAQRAVIIALALLLARSGDSWGQSQRPPNRNQAQTTQQPATTDQRGTEKSPAFVKILPPEDADAKAKQEAADRAAKDALDTNTIRLGIAAIAVAFLQFIAIGVQAWFLWRTVRVSGIAAKAAKDSADIAKRTLAVTQRAFVQVTDFPWLWRPDTDRPGKYFYDISPIIENVGNTPTVDMKIIRSSVLRDSVLPDDFDFPYPIEPGASLIGAHQKIRADGVNILDDELLAVQRGEKYFYIWGTITYRDVFEDTPLHTTEFCTQIGRVIGNPLDPRDPHNAKGTTVEIGFRIYPRHQRTD